MNAYDVCDPDFDCCHDETVWQGKLGGEMSQRAAMVVLGGCGMHLKSTYAAAAAATTIINGHKCLPVSTLVGAIRERLTMYLFIAWSV
jgi:hypothetical protein